MLKKKMILGTALLALALPVIASADLIIENHTAQYSTVRVTSGHFSGKCSSEFPNPRITQPHSTLDVSWGEVIGLCLASPGGKCTANIYMNNNCSDPEVATAELTLNPPNVAVTPEAGTGYAVSSSNAGNPTVIIDPTS